MKKMLSFAFSAIMMAVCSTTVQAQDNEGKDVKDKQFNREELAEKQAAHIARELALDDATTQKYIEAYKAYQQEVWALGPHKKPRQTPSATEAESEQAIKARFEQSEKMLKIRQKYYKQYSKFLTQRQIERAYELERQSMNRLARHHGKRDMGRHPEGRPMGKCPGGKPGMAKCPQEAPQE